MTALAEKLKAVGVDTVGAALTAACTEALRAHPNNVADAWDVVGEKFGFDFLRGLMMDMRGISPSETLKSATQTVPVPSDTALLIQRLQGGLGTPPQAKPYQPRVIAPERLERRRELKKIIKEKYFTSSGTPWLKVSWHELIAYSRDGKEALALLAAGPANVPNDGRDVEAVLGRKVAEQILESVRNG